MEKCKEMELSVAAERLSKEDEKENSAAAQLKKFGAALHYAVSPMDDKDNINFIAFIEKFEATCKTVKVPSHLWVTLLKPLLTQRCQVALNRFHGPDSDNFEKVKSFLLHELRLSPEFYSHLFNSSSKRGNETYRGYMSRLTTLLEYYLQSKKVDTFEDLCQLLVCDKVKAQLQEHILNHVIKSELAAEEVWLNVAALSDLLDAFAATHSAQGNVKYTALGAQPIRYNPHNYRGQSSVQQPAAEGSVPPQQMSTSGGGGKTPVRQFFPNGNGAKMCTYCSRKGHTVNTCFKKAKDDGNQRTRTKQYGPNIPRPHNTIAPGTTTNQSAGNPVARSNQALVEFSPDLPFSQCDGDMFTAVDYLPSEAVDVGAPASNRQYSLNPRAEPYDVNTASFHVKVGQLQTPTPIENAVSSVDSQRADLRAQLAKLPYIRVAVKGLDATVMGLEDSGSMICLINAHLIQPLNLKPVGSAQVRGVIGDAVSAPLVYVKMKLVSSNMLVNMCDNEVDEDDKFISVLCAVCADLNDQLILSMSVVARLQ